MKPQLNAIGIVVSDMERAIAFYARLGLEFKADSSGHSEVELPGGTRLMLDSQELVKSLVADWAPPSGHYRVSFAFQLDSPAEVDAKFAELSQAGVEVVREPYDAFWGQRYATIVDPDGNGVDLYAAL